jgi:hypothetical protein
VAGWIVGERLFADRPAEIVDRASCERRFVGVNADRRHRLPSVH